VGFDLKLGEEVIFGGGLGDDEVEGYLGLFGFFVNSGN